MGRHELYLVDLPGYGYARGGATAADELRSVAETYLAGGQRLPPRRAGGLRPAPIIRSSIAGALLLVDSRHPGLDADRQAARWLESLDVDTHIVATKIDKLTRAERQRHLRAAVAQMQLHQMRDVVIVLDDEYLPAHPVPHRE